jgi:hypothetical protein
MTVGQSIALRGERHMRGTEAGRENLLEGDVSPVEVAGPLELRALDKEAGLDEVDGLLPERWEPDELLSLHLSCLLEICAHIFG